MPASLSLPVVSPRDFPVGIYNGRTGELIETIQTQEPREAFCAEYSRVMRPEREARPMPKPFKVKS